MILIPQLYIRNTKLVLPEGTLSPLFKEDPFATASALKDSGAQIIYCIDLSVPHVGTSPNLAVIKKIHNELGLTVYASGAFKTAQSIEPYISYGAELVALGSVAYQQPAFLSEACKRFPGKIAVHIDVKGSRVTIPGYAVAANKTALDYAKQFMSQGVRYFFYSEVGPEGRMTDEHANQLKNFCVNVTARVICTSEVQNIEDVLLMANLGAPKLDGLVLAKPLSEGRIDLRAAITAVDELSLASGDEPTMTEM